MTRWLIVCCCVVVASFPALSQERLHPVSSNSEPTILTEDHASFVAEKSFEYKLTLGFPKDDKTWFLPSTDARIIALWLRIHNVSRQPIEINPSKFTSTDDKGKVYAALTTDEAFNRIIAGTGDTPVVSKTLRGISLGRAGAKVSEEQVKEDIIRYALQPAKMPAGAVAEGLVYFEAPDRKKFAVGIRLGDLWSRSFPFSTEKQK